MSTITLQGAMYPYSGTLGASWFRRKIVRPAKRASRAVKRKVTRPVSRVVQRTWRPVDRRLKKTPVVRTMYRSLITQSYATTLQFKEMKQAAKKTFKSAKADVAAAKRVVTRFAKGLALKFAKEKGKKVSRGAAKAILVPPVTAFAAKEAPPAAPFVAVIVVKAINWAYDKVQAAGKRMLKRAGINVDSTPYDALKMQSTLKSYSAPNYYAPEEEPIEEEKPAFSPLMLAPLALFLL